jgi:hypothetical protein
VTIVQSDVWRLFTGLLGQTTRTLSRLLQGLHSPKWLDEQRRETSHRTSLPLVSGKAMLFRYQPAVKHPLHPRRRQRRLVMNPEKKHDADTSASASKDGIRVDFLVKEEPEGWKARVQPSHLHEHLVMFLRIFDVVQWLAAQPATCRMYEHEVILTL